VITKPEDVLKDQDDPASTAPLPDGRASASGRPLVATIQLSESSPLQESRYMTEQFSYLSRSAEHSSEEPPTRQTIYRCEDEPIHTPSAIQRFGALIAIGESDDGRFVVRIVSENSESVTGIAPESLFELRCFTDVLTQSDRNEFLIRVRVLHANKLKVHPDVFTISLTSLRGVPIPLFCAVHRNDDSELIICEFELEQDIFNPIHPPDHGLPVVPVQAVEHQATEAERLLSTTARSQPLHAVSLARKSSRQLGPMELFHVLCEIQEQLASATTLSDLLDIVVGLVYELTSFHRVMVYQFDENASGKCVSYFGTFLAGLAKPAVACRPCLLPQSHRVGDLMLC